MVTNNMSFAETATGKAVLSDLGDLQTQLEAVQSALEEHMRELEDKQTATSDKIKKGRKKTEMANQRMGDMQQRANKAQKDLLDRVDTMMTAVKEADENVSHLEWQLKKEQKEREPNKREIKVIKDRLRLADAKQKELEEKLKQGRNLGL